MFWPCLVRRNRCTTQPTFSHRDISAKPRPSGFGFAPTKPSFATCIKIIAWSRKLSASTCSRGSTKQPLTTNRRKMLRRYCLPQLFHFLPAKLLTTYYSLFAINQTNIFGHLSHFTFHISLSLFTFHFSPAQNVPREPFFAIPNPLGDAVVLSSLCLKALRAVG